MHKHKHKDKHPIMKGSIGCASYKGHKSDAAYKNQDRACVVYPFMSDFSKVMLCMYDGHGPAGDSVAEWIMDRLPNKLSEMAEDNPNCFGEADIAATMHTAFHAVDDELRDHDHSGSSGTTAMVAVLCDGRVWTAHAGDTRCVVARETICGMSSYALTTDHKPDDENERSRIREAGGIVTRASESSGPARVRPPSQQHGGLAMSRSLGDHHMRTAGVDPSPDVGCYSIEPNDKWLIIATDGLWDFITHEEACRLVWEARGDVNRACILLIATAAKKWRLKGHYRDDITVILVDVHVMTSRLRKRTRSGQL